MSNIKDREKFDNYEMLDGYDFSNNIHGRFYDPKEIQKEERILMLSNKEWANLQEVINNPKKATPALKELMNLEEF